VVYSIVFVSDTSSGNRKSSFADRRQPGTMNGLRIEPRYIQRNHPSRSTAVKRGLCSVSPQYKETRAVSHALSTPYCTYPMEGQSSK